MKNNYRVLDLFAGAGGFGLGFRMASEQYNLICSLEVDKWAVDTLSANNVDNQIIINKDIRFFDTKDKILNVVPQRPDIIIGGPPCQGFSLAGPVKDPKDPRNSLFKNFAQWVDVLHPKIFVMENVPGLVHRRNEKGENVLEIVRNTFEKLGYNVTVWRLNAANFGVPQNRERIFIVGNSLNEEILPPVMTHYLPSDIKSLNGSLRKLKPAINVIDSIGDLPVCVAGDGEEYAEYTNEPVTEYQRYLRGESTILFNHVTMKHTKRMVERFQHILNGDTLEEIPDTLKVRKRNGNGDLSESKYQSNYRHLRGDMVSYTIPASFYSNFIHPNQPRNITSREAARLQSFPDSYVFMGKRTQISSKLLKRLGKDEENHLSQYNQIGNAVPPLLAKAVATRLLEYLNSMY